MDPDILRALLAFAMFLPILAFHEAAHAWTAYRLGDDTAKRQGRLTLNPIAHIDPVGTLLIPFISVFILRGFALIGWGKPVPIDPTRLRRPIYEVWVALAGPASNVILASALLLAFGQLPVGQTARDLAETMAFVSLYLAFFNLLPIYPLDGWYPLKHIFRIPQELVRQAGMLWFVLLLVLINLQPVRYALALASHTTLSALKAITFFPNP